MVSLERSTRNPNRRNTHHLGTSEVSDLSPIVKSPRNEVIENRSIYVPKDYNRNPTRPRSPILSNTKKLMSFSSSQPRTPSKLSMSTTGREEKYHEICSKLILRPKHNRAIMKNSEIQADLPKD